MKIKNVVANNHRHAFEIHTHSKVTPLLTFPYGKLEKDMTPSRENPISDLYVDPELGYEGFTWVLASGAEGSLHMDSVLEENSDPAHLAKLEMYKLTVEAQKGLKESRIPKSLIAEKLKTSPAQLERLLDPANARKSMSQLITLLTVLGRTVDIRVR